MIREYLPRFARVQHRPPTDYIDLDLDRHYADSWPTYSQQYLDLVKAGKTPYLRTAGTGTNSGNCPLTAVGGGACNGHNPPEYLNAEFGRLELKVGAGPWREVRDGAKIEAPAGARVLCRAVVGNLGEASWLVPAAGVEGGVYLAGRAEYGLAFEAPIDQARPQPALGDEDLRPGEHRRQ